MLEIEQYLQADDIELRAEDIKILLEEHNNMKQDIKRLKEEYMMLQNASDEVEEELQDRIDKAIEYIETKWEKNSYYEDIDNCMKFLEINEYDKADLLNILRGDKE